MFRHFTAKHKNTIKTKPRRGCGSLTAVIRLQRAARNKSLCALITCLRNEKFQFAGLVAAKGKSRLVVAFDEDTRTSQMVRKTRQFFDWCRQVSKVESGGGVHFQSLSVV